MFWFMLQVDPIQSYLNLKIGLPPILKAGSSGISRQKFPYQKSKNSNISQNKDIHGSRQCKNDLNFEKKN
jgi:hypothetical protein